MILNCYRKISNLIRALLLLVYLNNLSNFFNASQTMHQVDTDPKGSKIRDATTNSNLKNISEEKQVEKTFSNSVDIDEVTVNWNETESQGIIRHTCPDEEGTWSVPAVPRMIIVGAQKAGTSALSHFLSQVPNLLRSRRNEPHFWDFVVKDDPMQWSTHTARCELIRQYHACWALKSVRPDTITFEKTPSLLSFPRKAKTIRAVLHPHIPKILIILRDPIARFYSNYKMNLQQQLLQFVSIEKNIVRDVERLRNKSVIQSPPFSRRTKTWNQSDFVVHEDIPSMDWRRNMVARGFYAPQIETYMEFFPLGPSLKVIHYENFTRNKIAVLNEILEWVGLPPHHWTDKDIQQDLRPVNITMKVPAMTNEVMTYLKHLYKPFNEKLAALLGEKWQGVWDNPDDTRDYR